jgi:uncharacterized protein (DUF1778 family)
MFGFGPPALEIDLNGADVRFRSAQDFEFSLAGRTSIPADKISRLVSMSDGDLLREAEGIRKLEKRFSEILSAAMQAAADVGPILKALDMSLVTQDNDWRTIIEALNGSAPRFEEYKRLALVKYMQYLRARQDVIRTLYAQRQQNRAEVATQIHAGGGSGKMRETLIFDLSEGVPDGSDESGMRRLPKGETVSLQLAKGGAVNLMLVRHACNIRRDAEGLVFTDDTGNETPLGTGRFAVGRDGDCEIPLHPEYRDISRKHLIVEVDGTGKISLTDVSSLGTFIDAGHMPGSGIVQQ